LALPYLRTEACREISHEEGIDYWTLRDLSGAFRSKVMSLMSHYYHDSLGFVLVDLAAVGFDEIAARLWSERAANYTTASEAKVDGRDRLLGRTYMMFTLLTEVLERLEPHIIYVLLHSTDEMELLRDQFEARWSKMQSASERTIGFSFFWQLAEVGSSIARASKQNLHLVRFWRT
jgi:hypothetical protein